MNPVGKGYGVGAFAADNDPPMGPYLTVQADEVRPIVRHHRPPLGDRKSQYVRVRDLLVRPACFQGGEDVVAQKP